MKLSTVCLLGLCHAGSAAALGLGDASVRSSLGQPLDVRIEVLGATPGLAADCFHVDPAGSGALARARLSLERNGEQAVLHVRSPQPVNDPFAQFAIVADCTARIQRDYVVLLDPPSAIDAPVVAEAPTIARRPEPRPASATAMQPPRAAARS
ncbi:MAG: hypothetical protein LDL19_03305, partial [Thiobacillus sp.]|nr:hypothetical protein [Thiobacillus sp.]